MTAALDEPGYGGYERCEQYKAADGCCPAPGKTAFALESATADKTQHANTDAMRQQIDYEV